MKRVIVRRSDGANHGKVIGLSDSIKELLCAAGKALCVQADSLRTSRGDVIDDTSLIRDDEILYVLTKESAHEGCFDIHTPTNAPLTNGNINTAANENPDWITLNVGGKTFTTTRYTLVSKVPDSMLGRMFAKNTDQESQWSSTRDNTGAYLIDRSPTYFEPVLDYLRHGSLVLGKGVSPSGVLEEAKFFGITALVEQLQSIVEKEEPATDHTPITRREFVFSLLSTPAKSELRCQGMNFSSADLSKLDLRNINFKYSNLRYANLSGANLSYCNFERADLSHVNMEGATLLNVKLVCAHIEGAVMTNCNFEDPAGSRTNMEGANMKNVNLEGSHMAGVNLRVATLRNSNLQNCDLRGAVLAGADLEPDAALF